MSQENRTARLTVLIDPDKKALFEEVCKAQDLTPSQVVRQLIRDYLEARLGEAWQRGAGTSAPAAARRRR